MDPIRIGDNSEEGAEGFPLFTKEEVKGVGNPDAALRVKLIVESKPMVKYIGLDESKQHNKVGKD